MYKSTRGSDLISSIVSGNYVVMGSEGVYAVPCRISGPLLSQGDSEEQKPSYDLR